MLCPTSLSCAPEAGSGAVPYSFQKMPELPFAAATLVAAMMASWSDFRKIESWVAQRISVGTERCFRRSVLSCDNRALVAPIQVPSFTFAVSGIYGFRKSGLAAGSTTQYLASQSATLGSASVGASA